MATIFTRIIQGEIPSYKIAETDAYLAFLDIFPLVKGHTLVIPKKEIDYIFDLEDEVLVGMMLFAKQVAKALKSAIPCERIGVAVIGLEVPHAHIHLVPMSEMADINFMRPKLQVPAQDMEAIAAAIRQHF